MKTEEIQELFESVITRSPIECHIDVYEKKTAKYIGYLFGYPGNYEIYLAKEVNGKLRHYDLGHTDSFDKGLICLAILNPLDEGVQ